MDESNKCIKKAIKIDENFEDAYYAIGRYFGPNEKGLIFLEKVIELNPNHLNANLLIAEIAKWEYSRQPFKLVEIWSRIIKLDPNNGNAYFERGRAFKFLQSFTNQKTIKKSHAKISRMHQNTVERIMNVNITNQDQLMKFWEIIKYFTLSRLADLVVEILE